MALIECPECKRAVSDRADACPGCGYPMATDAAKDKDGFADAWMAFRADKLKAAELPVVF